MVHSGYVKVATRQRCCWVDITDEVQRLVTQAGITAGICTVTCLHTTAAMTINENADPDVATDFFGKLASMVPRDPSFRHCEGNSDSHIKASLVGLHVQVGIENARLVLGTWQSIYFCEFDGPRSRRCLVTILGECDADSHSSAAGTVNH
ncbi:MAG: YjbQ family protein [Chitinispirillaceae bacterium]|nr:YjbQ family protein [Chitinispirillaceae bacterium]